MYNLTQPALAVAVVVVLAVARSPLNHQRIVISTEGGVFCRRSGETPAFRLSCCLFFPTHLATPTQMLIFSS
jgi:hypothetical protein